MLLVPEPLALGGAFAVGSQSARLLAITVGLQNLPEGNNAYRELRPMPESHSGQTLKAMSLLVPIGPTVAIIGYVYFRQNAVLLSATMQYRIEL